MKTRDICVSAVLTAFLTGGKLAIPISNIEVVTLLLIVYALTFKRSQVLLVCVAFVLIETFYNSIHTWVVLYLVYWPALVLVIGFIPRTKIRIPMAVCIGILFTISFGVLSTLLDVVLMGGLDSRFLLRFYFMYVAGIEMFVRHVVSNSVILSLLLPPLYLIFARLGQNQRSQSAF